MDQPQTTPPPEPAPLSPEPTENKRRNGFVAQKTRVVRDKINLMLLDGFTYRKVIEGLGEDGKDLVEDHIRSWYHGGYAEWFLNLERAGSLRSIREATLELLKENAGTPVQDAARTVAATQLYDLLLSFDPATLASALATKPELYLALVNALSRLCEGDASCTHRRTQQTLLTAKLAAQEKPTDKKLISTGDLKDLAHEIKIV